MYSINDSNNWIHVIQRISVAQTTHTILLSNCCPIVVLIRLLDHLSTEESGSPVNCDVQHPTHRNCVPDKDAGTVQVTEAHACNRPGRGRGRGWDTRCSSFHKHHPLPWCNVCQHVMPLVEEVPVGQRGRGGGEGSAWWCFCRRNVFWFSLSELDCLMWKWTDFIYSSVTANKFYWMMFVCHFYWSCCNIWLRWALRNPHLFYQEI